MFWPHGSGTISDTSRWSCEIVSWTYHLLSWGVRSERRYTFAFYKWVSLNLAIKLDHLREKETRKDHQGLLLRVLEHLEVCNKKETRKGNWKIILIKKVENSFRERSEAYESFKEGSRAPCPVLLRSHDDKDGEWTIVFAKTWILRAVPVVRLKAQMETNEVRVSDEEVETVFLKTFSCARVREMGHLLE